MITSHNIPLLCAGAGGGIATDIGTCPGATKGMCAGAAYPGGGAGAIGGAAAGAPAGAVTSFPHFTQKRSLPSNCVPHLLQNAAIRLLS
jgi:hypothetical protein